jgi:cytochrome P450
MAGMTADALAELVGFDPLGEAFQQNPYPFFEAMRAASPVWIDPATGLGFVTRHDLVARMLRDTQTFSSAMGATPNEPPPAEVADEVAAIKAQGWVRPPTMLTVDPPDHTRYRATVARSFNARVIGALRPEITAIVDDELDRILGQGVVDVNARFSVGVPVRVIVRALNLDSGREADIKQWSDATTAGIGSRLSNERAIAAARGTLEMQRYEHAELVDRQRCPRDNDLLTQLVNAEFPLPDGDNRALTMEELMGIFQQLLGAGNETTTKLFSQMIRNLADHPDEWRKLQADPTRAASIVEEALRLAAPTQGMFRVVTRDIDVDGVQLTAGQRIVLSFAAANRDPAVFPDPHAFDPDRANVRDHLAFGLGVHFCIGAPLSRLESIIALERLAARCAEFRLSADNTFEFLPSYMLRGLRHLWAEFDPVDASVGAGSDAVTGL